MKRITDFDNAVEYLGRLGVIEKCFPVCHKRAFRVVAPDNRVSFVSYSGVA